MNSPRASIRNAAVKLTSNPVDSKRSSISFARVNAKLTHTTYEKAKVKMMKIKYGIRTDVETDFTRPS